MAHTRRFIAILFILLIGSTHLVRAEEASCRNDKRVVGPCFEMTGTVFVQANLRVYLQDHKTGRNYVLGFNSDQTDSKYSAPDGVLSRLGPDNDASGRFVVCPLSRERKGRMQTVCISEEMRGR